MFHSQRGNEKRYALNLVASTSLFFFVQVTEIRTISETVPVRVKRKVNGSKHDSKRNDSSSKQSAEAGLSVSGKSANTTVAALHPDSVILDFYRIFLVVFFSLQIRTGKRTPSYLKN